MIVGVCRFSWSGLGAVLDYLIEFEENQVYTPGTIIAYHPDGLCDLDIYVNENCGKFLPSGVVILRFKRIADYLLEVHTNGWSGKIKEKYTGNITQAYWGGLEQG